MKNLERIAFLERERENARELEKWNAWKRKNNRQDIIFVISAIVAIIIGAIYHYLP